MVDMNQGIEKDKTRRKTSAGKGGIVAAVGLDSREGPLSPGPQSLLARERGATATRFGGPGLDGLHPVNRQTTPHEPGNNS